MGCASQAAEKYIELFASVFVWHLRRNRDQETPLKVLT